MFWKWTTLALFLILVLIASFVVSHAVKYSGRRDHIRRPFENVAEDYALNDSQKQEFDRLLEKHRSELHTNFKQLRELQVELDEVTGEFADRQKTKDLSHQITLIEQANRDSSIDLFYDLYSIMDDGQKSRLKKKFSEKSKKYRMHSRPPGFRGSLVQGQINAAAFLNSLQQHKNPLQLNRDAGPEKKAAGK